MKDQMFLPDHETAVDLLNYEAISSTVVELLTDNRKRALTMACPTINAFTLRPFDWNRCLGEGSLPNAGDTGWRLRDLCVRNGPE